MSITGSHPPLGTNNLETTYLQGQSLQWPAAVGGRTWRATGLCTLQRLDAGMGRSVALQLAPP